MRAILLLPLIICFNSCTLSGNVYVSPEGNDDYPGTKRKPFRTIAHAVAKMEPGDTCFLMEGQYHESIDLSHIKG